MKRIDRIYSALKEQCSKPQASKLTPGFSAQEIADLLDLDRSNVSRDLNFLFAQGIIDKAPGKPALFYISSSAQDKNSLQKIQHPLPVPPSPPRNGEPFSVKADALSSLIGAKGSLQTPVKQAQAAVLYPPRGLHTLLLGETGVGKSFFAKLIHQLSRQRDKNFIHVNCNAIPDALFESELFGYAEGAFTGAAKSGKKGLLELAQNGTIFLDEIGDLPLPIQIKLLNVLQEKSFYKVGSSVPVELKARIITATNKDLLKLVKEGKFREDLYYRLNVLPIQVPSLRSRSMDIQIIAKFFLDKFNTKYNAQKQLSSDAFLILGRYSWPGNIRELENLMERLVITSDSPTITAGDVVNILQVEENALLDATDTMPLKKAVEIFEKQLIRKALEKYKSTRKAAKALDIAQSTIVKKMKDNPG